MAAVVTGVGLGLERSSASLLGANGLFGSPAQGGGGDDVYVNAATGNLIDTRTDQILTGIGLNDVIAETYNGQGAYSPALGVSGSGWMGDYQRHIGAVSGTVNTAGSTVTRVAADGSVVTYSYQTSGASAGLYTGNEGAGPNDTLQFNAATSQWTWTDGATQVRELYDGANGGRITSAQDLNGNSVTYNYSGSQLVSIYTTDTSGYQESTNFSYNGAGYISSISTHYYSAGLPQTLTQEYYSYDTSGRLSTITVDLSPTDNSTADGNTFVTTYGYLGATDQISSITGSDGSSLTVAYFAGTAQVSSIVQAVASGVTRTTSFSQTYGSGAETVTDPLGIASKLTYTTTGATAGLLTQVNADLTDSAGADLNQVTSFSGWTNLNVGQVTAPDSTAMNYVYDSTGNRTKATDGAGNVTTWTYDGLNQLLTETTTPSTGSPETSYFVRDAKENVDFAISPMGEVTQFLYNGSGQQTSAIRYTNDTFIPGISSPPAPTATSSSQVITENTSSDPISLALSGGAATGVSIVTGAAHGTVSVSGALVTYTPTAGYTGADSFTYTASNASGASAAATVSLTVANNGGVLPVPTAAASSQSVLSGSANDPIALSLSGGAASGVTITSSPAHGALTLSGASVKYTPTAGYTGTDSFTYQATNAAGASAAATVSLTVSAAGGAEINPTAFSASSNYTSAYSGLTDAGMSDGNFTSATSAWVTNPDATAFIEADLGSSQAIGNIRIADVPTALCMPTGPASLNGALVQYSTNGTTWTTLTTVSGVTDNAYTQINFGGVSARYIRLTLASTSLSLGDFMIFSQATAPTVSAVSTAVANSSSGNPVVLNIAGSVTSVAVASGPSHGTATASGTTITYTPTAGYTGADSFTYTATNASGTSAAATATITVNAPVMTAPTANAVTAAVSFDSVNDPIIPNITSPATSVAVGTGPTHGTVHVSGTSITYTPTAGYSGADSFTYTATNSAGTSSAATVSLTVNAGGPPTLVALQAWAAGLPDLQNTQRTDTTYDLRGNVASVETYGADTSTGAGAASTTENSLTTYVYDSAGRETAGIPQAVASGYAYQGLTRLTATNAAGAVTVYDGLDGVLSATNLAGQASFSAYALTSTTSYSVDAAGTVTLTARDQAGEVTSTTVYANRLTPTQLSALAGLVGAANYESTLVGYVTTSSADETTTLKYDADGRLMMTTDPKGNKTYFLYDTLGRKTAVIDALGDMTEYRYTAASQVAETIQYATPLTSGQLSTLAAAGATTAYSAASFRPAAASADRYAWSVYDADHRLIETIDGLGSVTAYGYNGDSDLVSTTQYANQLTSTQLTTFKPAPPTTQVLPTASSSDRTTRDFYDGDDRLVGTLDADGYFTETQFNDAGQKVRTIDFATQVASTYWASGTFAQITGNLGAPSAADDNTWYVYDARGLLRGQVDGDGDVTQYHYDPLGQVDQTIAGQQLTVSTLLATPPTLATLTGLSTTGAAVTDLTMNLLGEVVTTRNNLVTTPVTNTFDTLGNLIETQDAGGNKTFFFYDSFNRKIAEVNALGALTTWTYDLDNAVASETTYGVAVSIPTSPGGAPPGPTDANNYRRSSYAYDADERVTTTTVTAGSEDPIEIGSPVYNASTNTWTITPATASGLSSTTFYDAFGNVWKSVDANGNATFAFYNAVGQKVASVDGDGYVTGYSLNAFWDVATQTQYATALGAGTIAGFAALTDNVPSTPSSTGNDRITTFTYDGDGDVLSQSVANVLISTVSGLTASTPAAPTAGSSTVSYAYNALGEQLTQTQATGDTIHYAYTGAGRLASITSPAFTDAGGGTDTPKSVYNYNALGEVTSVASGQSGSATRTTTNTYDAIGRKLTLTDASGFEQFYAYDNDGNLLTASYVRLNSSDTQHTTTLNGNTVSEKVAYTYSAANQELTQATADWNGSAWVSGDPTSTTYDTANLTFDLYGEVTGKGINGLYQETMQYDGAGRLVESDEGSGAPSYYLYDADGHMTAALASAGTSLYTSGVVDTLAQALVPGTTYGGSYAPGIELTFTQYDAKGQAIAVAQPFQQVSSATPTSANTYTSSMTYDAFGDALTTTNNLGYTTTSTYNTLGELTKTVAPSVTLYSAAHPAGYSATPTTQRFYDVSGRQIGTQDANGNYTVQSLLAGTGYGGSQGAVVETFLPDKTTLNYGYDVFGDQTKLTDQLSRVTTKTYDGMGRLLTQTRPQDTTNGDAALTDFYAYDGLGQQIAQTNSQLNGLVVSTYTSKQLADSTGAKQTTDYDSQGRIIATEDEMRTYETTYDYSWSGTQTTKGMGPGGGAATATFGGWTQTQKQFQLVNTVNDYGFTTFGSTTAIRTETTITDFFGHTVGQTDFGGATYAYGYNAAGEQTSQTSSAGENILVTYFNTGREATFTSYIGTSDDVTSYGYDGLGNTVAEGNIYYYPTGYCTGLPAGSTTYENETATYDAMGWLTGVSDQGDAGTHPMSVSYGYDANGNVVTTTSQYTTLGGNGTASSTSTSPVTYWNSYDQMNRQLVANGTLISGTVTRGLTGTDIMYDAAGERAAASTMSVTCTGGVWYDAVHTEWYSYTADGYLETVQVANANVADPSLPLSVQVDDSAAPQSGAYTAVSNVYNAQGQQTSETEDSSAGHAVYIRSNIAYNADGQVTLDDIEQVINGTDTQYQDDYFYTSVTGSNSTNTYQGGQQTLVATVQRTGGHAFVYGYAYTYGWTTEALQSQIAFANSSGTTYTSLSYGASNNLTSVSVGGSPSSTVTYATNDQGQIMDRTASGGSTVAAEYFYLNGHEIGSVGNSGADQANYATTIANEATPPSGPPQSASADLGNTYVQLGGSSPGAAAGSYTVQSGDTLQSIAQSMWGDSSLWYLLANANGLGANAPLAAGQVLSVPNAVVNPGNTSSTFKPYNSAQSTGQIQPNPAGQHHNSGCGGIGAILGAIVGAAVAFLLLGPAGLGVIIQAGGLEGIAAGVAVGVAADVASQLVELATGAESSFNWAGVALAAIGGAVSAGINPALAGLDKAVGGVGSFGANFANGAIDSVVTQGIGVATGLQKSFDWAGVATSGLEAGVTAAVGQASGSHFLGSAAALLVGATARSVLTGEDFGQSLIQEAPSTVAAAIGDMLGGEINSELNPATSTTAPAAAQAGGAAAAGNAGVPAAAQTGGGSLGDGSSGAVTPGTVTEVVVRAHRTISSQFISAYFNNLNTAQRSNRGPGYGWARVYPILGTHYAGNLQNDLANKAYALLTTMNKTTFEGQRVADFINGSAYTPEMASAMYDAVTLYYNMIGFSWSSSGGSGGAFNENNYQFGYDPLNMIPTMPVDFFALRHDYDQIAAGFQQPDTQRLDVAADNALARGAAQSLLHDTLSGHEFRLPADDAILQFAPAAAAFQGSSLNGNRYVPPPPEPEPYIDPQNDPFTAGYAPPFFHT